MELVTLSISRKILEEGSRDQNRMALYAEHLSAFHLVVLTRHEHGFSDPIHKGRLHIYPTNSRSKFMMLFDAFRLAFRLLKDRKNVPLSITAQDPLELGVLSFILSKVTGVPYTVQIHGDYFNNAWLEGMLTRRLRRCVIPFVLRHAQKVRVVSERIRVSLEQRGLGGNKVHVLPIRPELDTFLNAKNTSTRDRVLDCPPTDVSLTSRRDSEADVFTVVTASRLAPEKNIPMLIEAFSYLHTQFSDTRLCIFGEGVEQSHIEACIEKYALTQAVQISPWTDQIEKIMADGDVFALASKHESYALVLIEALATGTPVVTTDVGCVGELVLNGIHGIVVPVGDARSFGNALISLYMDRDFRRRLGENGSLLAEGLSHTSETEYAKKWVAYHSV